MSSFESSLCTYVKVFKTKFRLNAYLNVVSSEFFYIPLIPLYVCIFQYKLFSFFFSFKCHIKIEMVSCHTCWGGIFRCRRASAVGWVDAGPSRCSAAPRGRALRLPTHRPDSKDQSSRSEDILLAACHSGSVSGVRADRGARRFHRAETSILEKPLRVWPNVYFTRTGLKDDKEAVKRMEAGCFWSRTIAITNYWLKCKRYHSKCSKKCF